MTSFIDTTQENLENLRLQLKYSQRQPIELLTVIEKAVQAAKSALYAATSRQSQIQNQHNQLKAEADAFHEQSLQSALKGDQISAVQTLVGEANHKKLAEVLYPQIEDQGKIIPILKENLESLIEMKFLFEQYIHTLQREYEVDKELESMKAQLTGNAVSLSHPAIAPTPPHNP